MFSGLSNLLPVAKQICFLIEILWVKFCTVSVRSALAPVSVMKFGPRKARFSSVRVPKTFVGRGLVFEFQNPIYPYKYPSKSMFEGFWQAFRRVFEGLSGGGGLPNPFQTPSPLSGKGLGGFWGLPCTGHGRVRRGAAVCISFLLPVSAPGRVACSEHLWCTV